MNVQHPASQQSPSATSTEYRIIGVLVTRDISYEYDQPLFTYPVVLTSAGFQVRLPHGGQPLDEEREPTDYSLASEEKVLGLLPAHGRLIMLTSETDQHQPTWEFRQ